MSTDSDETKQGHIDYHSIALNALNLAEELGATQTEIVVRQGHRRAIEIRNSLISGSQQQSMSGVGIRAYIGNKLGISSNTLVSEASITDAVEKAVKLAKLAPEDRNFRTLPNVLEQSAPHIPDLYDGEIANMEADQFIDIGNQIIDGSKVETEGKLVVGGQLSVSIITDNIVNSLGIDVEDSYTSAFSFVNNSIIVDPTNVGSGFEVYLTRKLDKGVDFGDIGRTASEKAKKTLGAREIKTKRLPVLFDHRATGQSLQAIVGNGVNGTNVMLGTSYFADKIGNELGVEGLNITDNPHVAGGFSSTPVDAEGVVTQVTKYMDKGVLVNYATNSYTANKLGIENNAHAQKMGFSGKPRCGIWQLHVDAGDGSYTQMLEDMREGIFMESGINASGGSQNISAKINRGFYVKDGEIQHAVKNTMIGSDVFSFLKGINRISKELRIEFGSQTPAILIDEMSISGITDTKSSPRSMMGI